MNLEIDITETDVSGSDSFQQVVALELALGCSLSNDLEDWPTGLVRSWNDAVQAGAMVNAERLGDMARAYLAHRIANLNHL